MSKNVPSEENEQVNDFRIKDASVVVSEIIFLLKKCEEMFGIVYCVRSLYDKWVLLVEGRLKISSVLQFSRVEISLHCLLGFGLLYTLLSVE
jgi:hypothetical protein